MPGCAQLADGVGRAAGTHEDQVGGGQCGKQLGVVGAERRAAFARRDDVNLGRVVGEPALQEVGDPTGDAIRVALEPGRESPG